MERSCLTCKSYDPEKSSEGRYYCKIVNYIWNHDCGLKHDCMEGGYKPRKEKKMDKQTAIINHRHMWGWLSLHPGEGKELAKKAYMKQFGYEDKIKANCFLCQYVKDHHNNNCDKCPVIWPLNSQDDPHCNAGGLWDQWDDATDPFDHTELARQIRDLPEREEEPATLEVYTYGEPGIGRTWMDKVTHPETPPPPPKLTRAEAIAKTRKQWRWYANNPTMDKVAYFINKGIPYEDQPYMLCYLCEWTKEGGCVALPNCGERCPLEWPGGCCELKGVGLFEMWNNNTDNLDLRISTAWLISRLPEKA